MRAFFKKMQRSILWNMPIRRFLVPRYQYSFSPGQLSYLNGLFIDSHAVDGISVEIGCFVGATTVFLNANYHYGMPRRKYIAMDTFCGFVKGDIEYEGSVRGKSLSAIHDKTLFNMNSQSRFDYTMRINGNTNVVSMKMDVNNISEAKLSDGISFCLVDVDLYRPTLSSLRHVIPRMRKGGVLIVDDCIENADFDGSLQAIHEASREFGCAFEIHEAKMGIIRF